MGIAESLSPPAPVVELPARNGSELRRQELGAFLRSRRERVIWRYVIRFSHRFEGGEPGAIGSVSHEDSDE